jgi:hypothetical protein
MLTLVLYLCFDKFEGRIEVVGEWHGLIEERWVVVAVESQTPAGFGSCDS